MAEPLPQGVGRGLRILRFCDLLEDSDPSKLSWTKIGVACSTICTALTGFTAALQSSVADVAHTDWKAFGLAIGFHAVTKTAHEIKRRTEKS